MEDTLQTLAGDARAADVDGSIAEVDHVFQLVGTREAIEAEEADEPR